MKKAGLYGLSLYFVIYFLFLGFTSFSSKYFMEIGLNESQIGILTSVPALVSMCFMPLWGARFDRSRLKKRLLAICSLLAGIVLLPMDAMTDFSRTDPGTGAVIAGATRFLPFLLLLTLHSIFSQPLLANANAIAIEYVGGLGRSFGPIRALGSASYQVGALIIGLVCVLSLRHIFTAQAFMLIATSLAALLIPNVAGHQNKKQKISPLEALRDKRVRWLLLMVLVGACTSAFSGSFFGAYLQTMGVSNLNSSILTFVAVSFELPMLFFSTRVMRLCSIWKWMLIGYFITSLRWFGLAAAPNAGWWLLLLCQVPATVITGTLEYFPSVYLGSIVAPELSSSVQTLLYFVSFGLAKVIGSLIGGYISEMLGLDTMFAVCGVLLLIAGFVFWPICRKLDRAELQAAI